MKLGIIGTGRIADRFIDECKYVEDVEVACVYNPHIQSAKSFIDRHSCKAKAFDELENIYEHVDAVYIAAPHEQHFHYAKEALKANKHVLCEKPLALNAEDASYLYKLAKVSNLICIEAIKTAYCHGFGTILQLIEDDAIGKVHDVEATFTKIGAASGREMWGPFGGSFFELGSYGLLPVVKILGTDSIDTYINSIESPNGNDCYSKMIFSFDNATATVKTGLGVKSEGELIVSGEKGYIRVPAPWWLTKYIEVHHEDPNQVEKYTPEFEGAGLRYEIREFCNYINTIESIDDKISDGIWDELMSNAAITPSESIWMADQMEAFKTSRDSKASLASKCDMNAVGIWAHRGCSYKYPENTILAFEEAARISGIKGIEFDVQRCKSGELVVIHDEMVDRTTDGKGRVCDKTLEELKKLNITPSGQSDPYLEASVSIPTFQELLEKMTPYCRGNGLLLNIELKNGVLPYDGMEEQVLELVREYDLEDYVVYSSFNHESMARIKELDPKAKTGALASDEMKCLEGAKHYGLDALHPSCTGMLLTKESIESVRDMPVRMYTGIQPLFGQDKVMPDIDLRRYAIFGATDIIVNNPEDYLSYNAQL